MANKLPYFAQVLDKTGHVSEVWKNYFLGLGSGGGGGGVESVSGTANRITVTGATNPVVNIASNYAGQTSITTLGTVIAGTWQGTPIATGFGGTGLTSIGTAGQLLAVNGAATGLEYVNPPSPISAGNPTAQVGLTAVNGVAVTFMRSDAAPALDQAITPTWTGVHAFSNAVTMSSTLGVTGNLTNTVLAGTGTRLVTATSAGLLGNATTIAGNYTFSGTIAASNLSGTNTGDQTITLTGDVTGSGTGSFAATIANNAVTDTKLRDSAALSVIGRSANSSGDPADIVAGSDAFVLRRSGTAIGFGTIGNASITDLAWSKITGTPTIIDGSGTASRLASWADADTLQAVSSLTSFVAGGTGISVADDGDGTITISQSATAMDPAVILAPSTSARNVVQSTTDAVVPLSVRARAGQAASVFEAQNSGGTAIAWITNVGDFRVERSNSGATVQSRLVNTSNTASSSAEQYISVAGTSAGDPTILLNITGGSQWSLGSDNSAGDAFTVSLGGALGTNDRLRITTAGAFTIPDLAGSGSRMVVADSNGLLSTSAIPTGTVTGSASANQVAVFSGASAIGGSGNLTFDGSTLALTGAQTISSTLTGSGDIVLTQTAGLIRSNTADASDTKAVSVTGGGALSTARGAYVTAHGNEHGTFPGQLQIVAGAISTGGISFITNNSVRYSINNSGAHAFATAVTMSSTLGVTGDATLSAELHFSSSTTPGEYWHLYKEGVSHDLSFYNGSLRMSLSPGGDLGVTGALIVTGTTTLSSLAGSTTRVMLSSTSGVVSASDDLIFDSGILELTGNMLIDGTLEVEDNLIVQGAVTLNDLAGSGIRTVTAATDGSLSTAPLISEESDSFTASWSTGWTTTPTSTVYYSRIGDSVTVRMDQFQATSNGTTATTATGDAPSSIRPASGSVYIAAWLYNNGLPEAGWLRIESNGRLSLLRAAAPSFTNSGTKGTVSEVTGGYSLAT